MCNESERNLSFHSVCIKKKKPLERKDGKTYNFNAIAEILLLLHIRKLVPFLPRPHIIHSHSNSPPLIVFSGRRDPNTAAREPTSQETGRVNTQGDKVEFSSLSPDWNRKVAGACLIMGRRRWLNVQKIAEVVGCYYAAAAPCKKRSGMRSSGEIMRRFHLFCSSVSLN